MDERPVGKTLSEKELEFVTEYTQCYYDSFVRSVAATILKTKRMSYKQAHVLESAQRKLRREAEEVANPTNIVGEDAANYMRHIRIANSCGIYGEVAERFATQKEPTPYDSPEVYRRKMVR